MSEHQHKCRLGGIHEGRCRCKCGANNVGGNTWNSPLPPHAAGEEVTPESLAAQVIDRGEPITVEQLHALHPPAASQAAPEMPEWVYICVEKKRSVHEFCKHVGYDVTPSPLLWLADRVAELERAYQNAHSYYIALEKERDSLQASAAQDTKR